MKNMNKRCWFGDLRRLTISKWIAAVAFNALCISTAAVYAGPGAHGPDGQHLDSPPTGAGSVGAFPRIEAKTDLFELVGSLSSGRLSILIDRFSTNEPLLNAKVEVEFGKIKASAKFDNDVGDYAVEDPAFLNGISVPGAHPLVFTVVAGDESDLLDGTLTVTSALEGQSHAHGQTYLGLTRTTALAIGIGTLVLLLVGGLFFRNRMKRNSSRPYAGSR